MASLKKRKGTYYIRFSRMVDGKREQKSFSLGVSKKRNAERLKVEYQEKYEKGEIDPFSGWTPKKEKEKQRREALPTYMSLREAGEKFLEHRTQAGEVTKQDYRTHFRMLERQVGRTMPVQKIKESDIREFCFREDLKKSTQKSYLRHLKPFFNWLEDQGIVTENVADPIKYPKVEHNIVEKTINEEQLEEIVKAYNEYQREKQEKGHISQPFQMQMWFVPLVKTVFYTGLRASEVVNLTWSEVDLKERFIRITNKEGSSTKSGKERSIPIRKEKLKPVLEQWHGYLGKPQEGYVFPSATGSGMWDRMSSGNVSKTFKKYVRKAGLPETVNFHGLRHSCATQLLREGMPIVQVSKMLGHSSLEVTRIYEHLDETDLKDAIDRLD